MRTDSGYLLEYNSILEEAPLSQIYIICEHHITMARELEDKLSFLQPHVLKDVEAVIDQSHKALLTNKYEQMQIHAQQHVSNLQRRAYTEFKLTLI